MCSCECVCVCVMAMMQEPGRKAECVHECVCVCGRDRQREAILRASGPTGDKARRRQGREAHRSPRDEQHGGG